MDFALETFGISKRYKKVAALDGVSLHVPKGGVYGLIGKNGAGKTTLLSVVSGVRTPDEGTYRLLGVRPDEKEIGATRRRTGCLIDEPALFGEMSAEENINYQLSLLGLPKGKRAAKLLDEVGLSGVGKTKARRFSRGMRQRLGLALALCGDPDLLLLDEPEAGVDPEGIIAIRELLLKLNRERQVTVVISSHLLDELSRIATHYGFLDGGRLIEEITAGELERKKRKCRRLTLSSAAAAAPVLEQNGFAFEVASVTDVRVFGEIPLSELTRLLDAANVEIKDVQNESEGLEGYFVNLLGGEKHDA